MGYEIQKKKKTLNQNMQCTVTLGMYNQILCDMNNKHI